MVFRELAFHSSCMLQAGIPEQPHDDRTIHLFGRLWYNFTLNVDDPFVFENPLPASQYGSSGVLNIKRSSGHQVEYLHRSCLVFCSL